ncbi:hypothetical protein V9K67_26865 [Paraflavisolibacter sp. H34]|uniref:hypothetical protein n=1 Tax=Huijunlia imazamoxiresistens TaxID=3127457 RepID=UPI00301A666A
MTQTLYQIKQNLHQMVIAFLLIVGVRASAQEYPTGNNSRSYRSSKIPYFLETWQKIDTIYPFNNDFLVNQTMNMSSDTLFWIMRGSCKFFAVLGYAKKSKDQVLRTPGNQEVSVPNPIRKHAPFLTVHGNVQYDFLYRSYVDTPFSQHDFHQHTVQSFLSIRVKDRYPVNLNLSNRRSNSPYFRNFSDVNFQFDKVAFLKDAKQRLWDHLSGIYLDKPELKNLDSLLKRELDKYNLLKAYLNGSDALQILIKQRERVYYRSVQKIDTGFKRPSVSMTNVGELLKKPRYKLDRPAVGYSKSQRQLEDVDI